MSLTEVEISEMWLNRANILKSLVIAIGGIVVFWMIQRPGYILNQRASAENISRERARLIIDLIKQENPVKVSLGLEVIQATYPDSEDEWLQKIVQVVNGEAIYKLKADYDELQQRRNSLRADRAGEVPGSIRYKLLGTGIDIASKQIKITVARLAEYGIELEEDP